jgi:MFS family permease
VYAHWRPSYDIFAISVVAAMLGYIHASVCPVTQPQTHPHPQGCTLSPYNDLALKVSTLVGNVIGSIIFGCLADFVGRKKM